MGQLAKGIAKCLATIGYVVNIKLIPYIFRVELCPPVTHYLMTITKLAQTMALVLNFKEEKTMWKKPAFIDLRLGLEVTLYISNR